MHFHALNSNLPTSDKAANKAVWMGLNDIDLPAEMPHTALTQ